MDNLTHSLTAFTLTRLLFPQAGRGAVLAAIVAANAPDLDVITGNWSRAHYLLLHRGVTHGVFGLLIGGLLCAGLMFPLLKKIEVKAPLSFLQLWLLCTVCALSHLPLDFLNSYGVRPWLPFSEQRYFGDLLFVVDPWVWMILGVGLFARVKWSPRQQVVWLFVTALGISASWYVGMFDSSFWMPWLIVLAVLLSLSRYLKPLASLRTGPAIAVGVLALYLGFMAREHRIAEALTRAFAPDCPHFLTQPTPGTPWKFTVIGYDDTKASAYHVDVLDATVEVFATETRNLNDPALEDVKEVLAVKAWRSFARIPTVAHRPGQLVLGDARYGMGRAQAWSELIIPLP